MADMFDRIADPVAAAAILGPAIFRSGFMALKTPEAGTVVAFECLVRKITPQSFAESYHVMGGKLAKRADRMLAEFIERGGDYTIEERTSEACRIKFAAGNRSMVSECTHEGIQHEPFYRYVKDGREKINENYATPRKRMQMLFARAVSDGVRAIDPGVCAGLYTPEEVEDMQLVDGADSKTMTSTTKASLIPVIPLQVNEDSEPESETEEATTATATEVEEPGTLPQLAMLKHKLEIAYEDKADSTLQAALAKRGLTHERELSKEQCEELMDKIDEVIRRRGGGKN